MTDVFEIIYFVCFCRYSANRGAFGIVPAGSCFAVCTSGLTASFCCYVSFNLSSICLIYFYFLWCSN